ncbi:hypothetical protein Misp01_79260 [Microtetraspora sp. NBRC 13810]|nr:hypothetical protein Misp01_79260 [Microtetraspora sp. NBRC 13810]
MARTQVGDSNSRRLVRSCEPLRIRFNEAVARVLPSLYRPPGRQITGHGLAAARTGRVHAISRARCFR